MTTEKLVNKALFGKTELASQKVELGKLDDIEKAKSNSLAKIKNHFNKRCLG